MSKGVLGYPEKRGEAKGKQRASEQCALHEKSSQEGGLPGKTVGEGENYRVADGRGQATNSKTPRWSKKKAATGKSAENAGGMKWKWKRRHLF